MPAFFERLQRNSRLYENNAPAYLRTHPLTTDRITDMENRVQGLGYRQVPDSLEFRLVQAKLLALQGSAAEACAARSAPEWQARRSGAALRTDAGVAAHGTARTGPRQHDAARAQPAGLGDGGGAGGGSAAGGNHAAAAAHYRDAIKRYPLSRPLAYGLADELIAAGRPAEAADMLRKDIVSAPDDHRRWGSLLASRASPAAVARGGIGSGRGLSSAGKPARGGRTARTRTTGRGCRISIRCRPSMRGCANCGPACDRNARRAETGLRQLGARQ